MSPFKLFRFPNLVVELRNILIKSMGIEVVARNHLQPPKTMFLPQIILKITIYKLQILYTVWYFLCHSHVICMPFVCAHILSICTCMTFVCQSYVLVCHLYVTRMYSYVRRMSLVCSCMSSICKSNVLVCQPYVTCMYSYVIPMSLVCTRMSFVCYSYVLVRHLYVVLPWTEV